jgi:hypothetical protein
MNKKMNIIYRICLIVIIAVSAVNVYIAFGDKTATDITLLDIMALANENGSDNYTCSSGGPGSTSCAVSSPLSSCSVNCSSGYYACCNAYEGKCQCRAN